MELIIKIDDDIAKGIRGENNCEVDPRAIVRSFQATIADAIAQSTPYNPTGDLISRETLLNEFDSKCQRMCPTCEYHKWNSKLKRYECELINTAPPVEPRIEYGTDGHPYKLSMTNGKEYERTKDDWRDNLIEVFRQAAEVGGDTFHLFEIERIINGEPI